MNRLSSVGGGAQVPPPTENVRTTVLDNGVRVVTDELASSQQVAFSVWAAVGSRDEPEDRAGASHFLEHLLFKGTNERSAREIAIDIDAVGGEMNAFTADEHTAYYARVPAGEARLAIDVITDVVDHPALRPSEFDGEREVILEELAAAADDPDDVVSVALFEALFPDHPLGREVLGTESSIESMTRDDVAEFFGTWYRPSNLVVAVAGHVTHDEVVAMVGERLSSTDVGRQPLRTPPTDAVVATVSHERPVDIAHLAIGWRAPSVLSDDRYAALLLNHVLGSGPSSRLFQEVREDRGLTYSISSDLTSYIDAGALSIQCATATAKAEELVRVVAGVVEDIASNGVTSDELARAKSSVRGSYLIGYEDAGARMMRLGTSEVTRGAVLPVSTHLERLGSVTLDEVARVASAVLSGDRSLSVVGPPPVMESLLG